MLSKRAITITTRSVIAAFCALSFGLSLLFVLAPHATTAAKTTDPFKGDLSTNAAPHLRINKWADDTPAEGGNFAFYVQYENDGDAHAENSVISDTLQGGMTYLSDTSGLSHTGSGSGPIEWDLGTVPPGESIQFDVFVEIAAAEGEPITNTAQITTTNAFDQGDPSEKESEWNGTVAANDTHLNIGKDAWTHDPAPDTDIVFNINICNNGSTASSEVTMTDTLPISLTLDSWWTQNEGWVEESSSDHQLALSRPTIPGNWCSEVYVRAHLADTVQQGDEICNTAVIAADSDIESDDNESTWCAQVNAPHTNLSISKDWGSGQLVPGGELHYWINYYNNGNQPVAGTIRVTDTLPVNTTFNSAWQHGNPFPPTTQTADYVVWEIDGLDNGYGGNFEVVLDVDAGASSGTVLTNIIEISPQPAEDSYDDNTDTHVETIYASAPNLRVNKWHNWNGDGQLGYGVQFENVGDQTANSVFITDTYPVDTAFNDEWGHDFWEPVTLTHDVDAHQLVWEISKLDTGWSSGLWFNVDLDSPGTLYEWYTNIVDITPLIGDADPADNSYTDVAFSGSEVQRVELGVDDNHIWGEVPAGPITITTPSGSTNLPDGGHFDWDAPDNILPGDTVTVAAGAGTQPVTIIVPDPFISAASSVTDTVWGQVDALDHESLEVDLNGGPTQLVQTDDSGNYTTTFADIPNDGNGETRYNTSIDYADVIFHHYWQAPTLRIGVSYGHDWVNGDTVEGTVVDILLTDSAGTTKATAQMTAGDSGGTHFNTSDGDYWSPPNPDIQPGDRVTVTATALELEAAVNPVGTVTGSLDMDADTVEGTIHADWFNQTLNAECNVWEENGPYYEFTVDSNGGPYACDFTPDWDLLPGQQVGVGYQEPDGDWVYNAFQGAAPHLRINKWADDTPAEGGNFAFYVQYENDGDAHAENSVISDTLQGGMTYLSDTSGLSHTGSGSGPIEWDLGTVPPGESIQFDVFVEIAAAEGEPITNTAQITTTNAFDQGDPSEKESEWNGTVAANDTHLNIGKDAWTHDPAPDTDIVFNINICNNGSTASSEVTMTDTLPISLTLDSWWTQNEGWVEESSSDHQLALSRPTIPGNWCSEVYVRAHLADTVQQGDEICNTAVIAADSDIESDDNESTWCAQVNAPHTNLSISKDWGSGQLVPGGELHYWINYYNNGNQPVAGTIRVTDTLPVNTTFNSAWQHGNPFPPTTQTADYVVWEIDGLDNGYGGNFEVVLDVDAGASSGTVLTNTIEISPQPAEDSYDDNTDTHVETIYAHGPNLRVTKEGDWHGHGDGHNAWYNITIQNVGDEAVQHVTITDTYPISMTLDGLPWPDWGQVEDSMFNNPEHWFSLTFNEMWPGYRARFRVQHCDPRLRTYPRQSDLQQHRIHRGRPV